ncbi:peptidase S8 [Haloferula helveola]|uniref:Peptidase S8 n=1 Tax=Haloferula helveola TaxID=490095 RepID=A0ABN6H868_9BACT|nr:peptidase S8 [Haloferula helveola]
MPDHLPNRLTHLRFTPNTEQLAYKGDGRGDFKIRPVADRAGHVSYLQRQVAAVQQEFDKVEKERADLALSSDFGLILNVTSEPDLPLAYWSLEKAPSSKGEGITLLNLRHEKDQQGREITKAAIFVPHGQLDVLEKKIAEYADPSKDSKDKAGNVTNPRNAPLLNNIHSISSAAVDALWTDPEPLPEADEPCWFELWIRRDDQKDWQGQLIQECAELGIEVPEQTLVFPDHVVVIGHGTRSQLESSLDLLNCLSEIRKARPCSVGLTDLNGLDQEEWIDEALERIQWPGDDAPAVCLLDTGVNRGHPLIEPALSQSDMSTVFGDGDTADDNQLKHGTPMAGLAAFGDLRTLMMSTQTWDQLHRLESVKLIRSSTEHDPENYGAVTLAAINEPESIAPDRPRVFCMAVTADGPNTFGNPSAWSTAVDIAAAGAQNETDQARVILVSAGNTEVHDETFSYPDTMRGNPVEDPAQAWNAISVGAVTHRTTITEDDDEARRCDPLAPEHHLSPYTRTSHAWCLGRKDWPIAPDVVMEGANLGKHRDLENEYPAFDSLAPLTTASNFNLRPIAPFNATSAATALAARIAAQVTQRYPDASPETIRGLLVHSARWPQAVLDRLGLDPHQMRGNEAMQDLMRGYGFGVINEQRALDSLGNQTTFFTGESIQPYKGRAGDASFNECHLIRLPWPVDLLQANPNVTCTLRVTLSYFIHPNPGTRSWDNGQKYKYASHLLGFTHKHKEHSLEEFRSRLHAEEEALVGSLNDPGWAIGPKLRGKAGSLVQDVWRGPAADLAAMEAIAVFPRAKGWWATRKYAEGRQEHNCHEKTVPYSLIVSLEIDADLPVYTEIEAAIQAIEAGIDITT